MAQGNWLADGALPAGGVLAHPLDAAMAAVRDGLSAATGAIDRSAAAQIGAEAEAAEAMLAVQAAGSALALAREALTEAAEAVIQARIEAAEARDQWARTEPGSADAADAAAALDEAGRALGAAEWRAQLADLGLAEAGDSLAAARARLDAAGQVIEGVEGQMAQAVAGYDHALQDLALLQAATDSAGLIAAGALQHDQLLAGETVLPAVGVDSVAELRDLLQAHAGGSQGPSGVSVTLAAGDVLDLAGEGHRLTLLGQSADAVTLKGGEDGAVWQQVGSEDGFNLFAIGRLLVRIEDAVLVTGDISVA